MNEIPILGDDPKKWVIALGVLVVSLIVGRFVQAFRNGEGIKGAVIAVWLGTNTPKKKDGE